MNDQDWMRLALQQASQAATADEVPIGALIVQSGELIATGHNRTIAQQQPTAHAELVAINAASQKLGVHGLAGAMLYVTIEPCLMCLGGLVEARIGRVVFGAYEPHTGALISRYQLADYPGHTFDWRGGVLQQECAQLIQDFFRHKR